MRISIPARQTLLVSAVCLLMVLITRLPLMPEHLFSFDSVNFALALDHFDPAMHQPQPPGYPFFVGEARLINALTSSPELAFAIIKLFVSTMALAAIYLLGSKMGSPGIGLVAAGLLLVNPAFWHSGLASPIRPHLALFSALFGLLCWTALTGNRNRFLLASALMGLSVGFRTELPLILFPLWLWTAWRLADRKLALRSALVGGLGGVLYVSTVLLASSSVSHALGNFYEYLTVQTYQTSPLSGAEMAGWKRMFGRNLVWYGVGALGWIWAAPWGWRMLRQSPNAERLQFLAVWFVPAFLLSTLLHGAAPGHTLAGQVPLCLLGAFSICAAEAAIKRSWQPKWPLGAALAGAMLVSTQLFYSETLPASAIDAPKPSKWDQMLMPIRYGLYETSYSHVRWVDQVTGDSLGQIRMLARETDRPVVVVWSREAEPVWRKVAYYLPDLPVYALEEAGDLAAPITRATLWKGSEPVALYDQGERIPVPIPANARIIWLLPGGAGTRLRQAVTLSPALPVHYTDLDPAKEFFDWRGFRFVVTPDAISQLQVSQGTNP